MTDANRPTETISPDRLRELIEVYNLQCFRGDTALALEELQRLRHYVATCGGTDNDGRCPMHHLAGVSKDTSEDDAFCGDCGEKLEAVRPGKHQHIGPCPSPGARVKQDAARYQFLRGLHDPGPNDPRVHTLDQQTDPVQVRLCFGDDLDAAVDAAMRQP